MTGGENLGNVKKRKKYTKRKEKKKKKRKMMCKRRKKKRKKERKNERMKTSTRKTQNIHEIGAPPPVLANWRSRIEAKKKKRPL